MSSRIASSKVQTTPVGVGAAAAAAVVVGVVVSTVYLCESSALGDVQSCEKRFFSLSFPVVAIVVADDVTIVASTYHYVIVKTFNSAILIQKRPYYYSSTGE